MNWSGAVVSCLSGVYVNRAAVPSVSQRRRLGAELSVGSSAFWKSSDVPQQKPGLSPGVWLKLRRSCSGNISTWFA